MSTNYVGVILAAGRGSRMSTIPSSLPKPVLPLLGVPILSHQLDALAAAGITEVYIVVGHRGFEVVREVERLSKPGIHVEYVQQEAPLGIAHALRGLEPIVRQPFVLLLGDAYFKNPRIDVLLRAREEDRADAILSAVEETDEQILRRDFCIVSDSNRRVVQVIEKPCFPPSLTRGIGMYLFTPVVFDAVRRTPRSAMRDEYEITDTIQIMVDDGRRVFVRNCVESHLNITSPQDILDLNLRILDGQGLELFVDPTAVVHPRARVCRSVLGPRVVIMEDVDLDSCVVFANAVVPKGMKLRRCVVTREGIQPIV